MHVYMLRWQDMDPVKLGYSKNGGAFACEASDRLWKDYQIFRIFLGGHTEYGRLVERFNAQHIRGNWYSFCPEMMGDLGLEEVTRDLDQRLPRFRLDRDRHSKAASNADSLRSIMVRHGVDELALAKRIDCRATSVVRWLQQGWVQQAPLLNRFPGWVAGELTLQPGEPTNG